MHINTIHHYILNSQKIMNKKLIIIQKVLIIYQFELHMMIL